MTINAIFKGGVFQPIVPVDLSEGEQVQLEVFRMTIELPRRIVSLRGLWQESQPSTDSDDWVSEAIAEIRRQSAQKIERLAQELSEHLDNE